MPNPTGINQYTKGLRTAHAGYKKQFAKAGKFNLSAPTSASARKEIAGQLKRARTTIKLSRTAMHELLSNAAASTRLRNLNKRK